MVLQIVLNILLQLLFTVGAIIIFGLIIGLCNLLVYKMLGQSGRPLVIATGIIGTPIHELSHATACLLFGHKITAMCLFDPSNENGVLGYVRHSYNKRNIYHVIGNFFIGVAPILIGSLILIFLEWLLARYSFNSAITAIGHINPNNFFQTTFNALGQMLQSFFSVKSFTSWSWWLFILLGLPLALHMDLSPADIKGAVPGFAVICGISIVINFIVGLISISASNAMTYGIAAAGVYIVGTLMITLIMALIWVFIAFTVYVIRLIARRA